jgi:hypothetical protein
MFLIAARAGYMLRPAISHERTDKEMNKRLTLARILLALFLTLSAMSLQPAAQPQSCVQECYRKYVECLRNGPATICDSDYDACLEACH